MQVNGAFNRIEKSRVIMVRSRQLVTVFSRLHTHDLRLVSVPGKSRVTTNKQTNKLAIE